MSVLEEQHWIAEQLRELRAEVAALRERIRELETAAGLNK